MQEKQQNDKGVVMEAAGRHNALTDVEGLMVGNYTDTDAVCGVTVVICLKGAVTAADVRGSAPGTRETDLLDPINLVQEAQAVVLSGGSVYGLAASDGVVRWLAEQGSGFPLEKGYVAPIVPAAVLYDLGRGKEFVPPVCADWGREACKTASDGPIPGGCFGAGTGAISGGIKGGLGNASLVTESGITIAAIVAVNSLGSVINPLTGQAWEIALELDGEFGPMGARPVELPRPGESAPVRNTTIGVVATDAKLTKSQAKKIAQMAHDGMARAIRPSHTLFDGDTVFCMATGKRKLPETPGFFINPHAQALNDLGHAAANCMSRAIIRGILNARTLAGITAIRDLNDMKA
ncbi:P1 family peptidase [Desulfococcaceae bacterium HSG8]|nr:P1 family peptidase [Desulfococcaceae bacterium HSG8]